MKTTIPVLALSGILFFGAWSVPQAHALSCLPVDAYLKDIVGKEDEVTILVGTVVDQVEDTEYTAEVLTVNEVKQGFAENKVFAYHQKHPDWNYLCNAGPAKKGEKSVYIVGHDASDKYNVYQRLSLTDPLVKTLDADLKKAGMEGRQNEMTSVDRMNQINSRIQDLIKEIKTLFKEYLYWKSN